MPRFRHNLPQLGRRLFLTDGGMETTLIFHEGQTLPEFAAFVLLASQTGVERLTAYFQTYMALAEKYGTGLILETPTWRASEKWGRTLGYSAEEIASFNSKAVELCLSIRAQCDVENLPVVISGCIGPKGDGYRVDEILTAEDAYEYHSVQISQFSQTEVDMITAFTLTHANEAIGIVRAAKADDLPVAIGFTVETDGRLPSGQSLQDAIQSVDHATLHYSKYFMVNCAHPTHFQSLLEKDSEWKQRIRSIRANASSKSHSELDDSDELDEGCPNELANRYAELNRSLQNLTVVGGCCGTDHRHLDAICKALLEHK